MMADGTLVRVMVLVLLRRTGLERRSRGGQMLDLGMMARSIGSAMQPHAMQRPGGALEEKKNQQNRPCHLPAIATWLNCQ